MANVCDLIPMDEMLCNEALDPVGFLDKKKMQLFNQVDIQRLIESESKTGIMYKGHMFRQIDIADFFDMAGSIYNAKIIKCNVDGFSFIALDWKPDIKCFLETKHKYPAVQVKPMRWLFVLTCDGREGEPQW